MRHPARYAHLIREQSTEEKHCAQELGSADNTRHRLRVHRVDGKQQRRPEDPHSPHDSGRNGADITDISEHGSNAWGFSGVFCVVLQCAAAEQTALRHGMVQPAGESQEEQRHEHVQREVHEVVPDRVEPTGPKVQPDARRQIPFSTHTARPYTARRWAMLVPAPAGRVRAIGPPQSEPMHALLARIEERARAGPEVLVEILR